MSTSTSRRRTNPSESELSDNIDNLHDDDGQAINSNEDDPRRGGESYDEDGSSEYTDDSEVEGERDAADGESPHEEHLDDDEDAKNPAFIPRKGLFYEHDSRSDDVEEQTPADREADDGDKQKLWKSKEKWSHDMFDERSQAPKTREELIREYGYDITTKDAPPTEPPRRYSRGRGRRGRASFGDFTSFSKSNRGQRGNRGSYGRGTRGGRYQNRNYENSQRYNQSSQQPPDLQEVGSQDVGSQDVRSQDVRSQDAGRDKEKKKMKSQDVRTDANYSERLADNSASSPANAHEADQRVANQNVPDRANNDTAPPQPTPAEIPKATTPAVTKEEVRPKRYSKQRQNVAVPPAAPPQQPVNQSPQAQFAAAPSNAPAVGSPQRYMSSPAQLMTPQNFMPGSSPTRQPMTGALPANVLTGAPRQPLPSARPPIAAAIAPAPVISQSTPLPVAGMLQAPIAYVVPNQGLPQQMPAPVAVQGIPQVMATPGIPQQGIPQQGIPQQGIPQQGIPQQGILQQGIPQQGIPQPGVPPQQFPHRPQLPAQMSVTPPVSETGVPLGGAVYYSSPAQQRPPNEGTTYYPTPHSTPAEPTGTTYYTSAQQTTATGQPGGTFYPPTAATEQQGPVYYDAHAQAGATAGQSKPRAKNVIRIVNPEASSAQPVDRLPDQTTTTDPVDQSESKPDLPTTTNDVIIDSTSQQPITKLNTISQAPIDRGVTLPSDSAVIQQTNDIVPQDAGHSAELAVKVAELQKETTELAGEISSIKDVCTEQRQTVHTNVDSSESTTEITSAVVPPKDENLTTSKVAAERSSTTDIVAKVATEREENSASDDDQFSDAKDTPPEGGDSTPSAGDETKPKVIPSTPNEQGDASSTGTESQV